MSNPKKVFIATGGSGGHIIPALAIAKQLEEKKVQVEFIGAAEHFSYLVEEEGFVFHNIKASKFANRGILGKIKAIILMYFSIITVLIQLRKSRPNYVLGMGSYASVAAVIAAKLLGIKTAIHEQNVKPGRTNSFLMYLADKVFLSFEETKQFLNPETSEKSELVVSGCPVQEKVIKAKKAKRKNDGKFRILVLGGSQGARILSDVVPQAIITLPEEIKQNIVVTQQARPEDLQRVKEVYENFSIDYEVETYFDDVPARIRQSNLIIARSGAGTVCETATLGRTAIFVPLLLADGHQMENARVLSDKNASFVLETARFTPSNLAYELLRLIENPEIINSMEENSAKAIPQSETAAQTIAKDISDEIK